MVQYYLAIANNGRLYLCYDTTSAGSALTVLSFLQFIRMSYVVLAASEFLILSFVSDNYFPL